MTGTSTDDLRSRLEQASAESVDSANQLTQSQLAKLQKATPADLDALRPQISDSAALDKLIEIVSSATARNENIADLQARIQSLGQNSITIIGEILNRL